MSVEENKAIVRRYLEEGWTNLDILDEIVADDIAMYPGEIRDLEGYKQVFAEGLAAFSDINCTLEDIIAEGDKVAVRWKFTGTHTSEYAGAPPTNKQVSWRVMTTFQISGGKVVEQWWVWQSYWQAQQLGIVPSWEEAAKQARSKKE